MSEARRKWASEQQTLDELERLGDEAMRALADYEAHAPVAALAESEHRRLRAKAVLRARLEKVPVTLCVYTAEADDEVADAYQRRVVDAAVADAMKERLRVIRTNQEALRTAVASKRDGVTGPGWGGSR